RHQEHLVAPAFDRRGDKRLGLAIHLGRVDMRHAKVQPAPERGDRAGVVAAVELPCPLPDDGDLAVEAAEATLLHGSLLGWPARATAFLQQPHRCAKRSGPDRQAPGQLKNTKPTITKVGISTTPDHSM